LFDEKYKKVANSTLQFITNCNYNKKRKHFDFIGQDGWYVKGQKKADYDQQPLEAAAAVDAYLFALSEENKVELVTYDKKLKRKLIKQ